MCDCTVITVNTDGSISPRLFNRGDSEKDIIMKAKRVLKTVLCIVLALAIVAGDARTA